jgi:hypothetical protein
MCSHCSHWRMILPSYCRKLCGNHREFWWEYLLRNQSRQAKSRMGWPEQQHPRTIMRGRPVWPTTPISERVMRRTSCRRNEIKECVKLDISTHCLRRNREIKRECVEERRTSCIDYDQMYAPNNGNHKRTYRESACRVICTF